MFFDRAPLKKLSEVMGQAIKAIGAAAEAEQWTLYLPLVDQLRPLLLLVRFI